MPKYRATLQVTGLTGENPRAARAALDEELRKRGIENCRIVGIDLEPLLLPKTVKPPKPDPAAVPKGPAPPQANAGGLLLFAATAWALWFFWWMFSASPE